MIYNIERVDGKIVATVNNELLPGASGYHIEDFEINPGQVIKGSYWGDFELGIDGGLFIQDGVGYLAYSILTHYYKQNGRFSITLPWRLHHEFRQKFLIHDKDRVVISEKEIENWISEEAITHVP